MSNDERIALLKEALGITDTSKDVLLSFELETVEAQVLSYINQEQLPAQLEKPLVIIAAAHWKSAGYKTEQAAAGPVTSVKRGDVTTAFAASSGADASAGTFALGGGDGFFGWRTVLNAHRKLRW